MKLISWNVNGFRACLDKGFADFFKKADADIFCIQESKMQPGKADFSPDGYYQYWYSAEKKGCSGTAVFTKREPLSVRYGIGIPNGEIIAATQSASICYAPCYAIRPLGL